MTCGSMQTFLYLTEVTLTQLVSEEQQSCYEQTELEYNLKNHSQEVHEQIIQGNKLNSK